MAITLGELLIKLTAKTDAFQKGMNDAKRLAFDSSGDIVSSLGRIGESLGKLKFDNLNQAAASLSRIGGIISGVAVGIATASIAAAEHVALQAKEIDKLSQSYGLSVQQISAFRVASQITGVSLDTITSGMSRLAKNAATVAEAVGGHTQKGAAAAFNALHVSVTDSQGKLLPLNDLLGTIAEKFSRMQDSTTKTALAIQIFGKGGAALIPFLNEGKEGLERLRQVSDDLGLTWTQADITGAKDFAESIELLKLKGEALEEQLAKGLYPALNNIATAFTKVDSSGNSAAHTLGEGLGEVLKGLAESAEVLGHDLAVLYLTIKQLGDPKASPLSIFADSDSVKSYEDALSSLDKQLNDVYKTLEKTHQSVLDTFPTQGGDAAGRLSALGKLFGRGGTPPPSLVGSAQDIHKLTDELRALSDETDKLIAKDSGDKYAQQLLAINIQIEKLRTFGIDHQNLGDSVLAGIAGQIDKLNQQINALNSQKLADFIKSIQVPLPAGLFNANPGGNLGPRPQAPSSFLQYDLAIKQLEKLHAAHEINDEDYEKERTALQEGARVFDQNLTSAQRYAEELKNLQRLLADNAITQDTFNRAVTSLGKISDSALKGAKAFFQEYADYAKEAGRQVYEALNNAFSKLEDTLTDFITKGKADWKSLFDSIQADIVKIAIRQAITGPLAQALGKLFGVKSAPKGTAEDPLYVKQAGVLPVTGTPGQNPADPADPNSQGQSGINGAITKIWTAVGKLFWQLGNILSSVFKSLGDFLTSIFKTLLGGGQSSGDSGGLSGLFGGGGGADSAGASGSFDAGDFAEFGGAFASGGPVSAGKLYQVNENGTELFKPSIGGDIIPLGGGIGSVFSSLFGGGSSKSGSPKGTSSDPVFVKVVGDKVSGGILSKFLSGLGLGGIGGGLLGNLFGGGKASGGPVSAGVLYRVNENLTEYFKPNVGGHIIPLGEMAAAGGGFTFAPTYYITTPNADTFRKSQHQLITEGLDSANRAQRRR